jgi:predicted short-subunit dehydrogenase-like oxidoreductase (DUF2520 family)
VLYPLQTFSRDRVLNFRDIPLFIEGESEETIALLKELAGTISGNVHLLSGDKRRFLHLAAVFACNFTNHMYALASEIMVEEGISYHLFESFDHWKQLPKRRRWIPYSTNRPCCPVR